MSQTPFRLSVITQEKIVVDAEAVSVTAPGSEGYVGIWANHAPLATALDSGTLTVVGTDNVTDEYVIGGGFLEVSNNVVTVLADFIEHAGEIDPEAARKDLQAALEQLEDDHEDLDVSQVHEALKRNKIRLKLAQKRK